MRAVPAMLLAVAPMLDAAASEPARSERVNGIVSVLTLMRDALVPGLQMATIVDGRVTAVRALGVVDAETSAPVTRDTVFEAASLGKPVFAYGVLKLAGAGRIDLDAPASRYLPDLQGPAARLTARQLLSHTGGLPNGGNKLDVSAADVGRFSYSGDGFRLLQRAVEAITGQPLNDYMQAAVFQPLGMTSSSYVWRDDFRTTKAFGHGFTGANAGRNRIPDARAHSSLETTAADYARFMLAMIKEQATNPAIRQAFAPQVRLERGCGDCLGKPKGAPSEMMSWGLGWGLAQTARGRFAWHWGDNNTMQGYAAIAPDGSRGVVVLTNSANGHSIMPSVTAQALGVEAPGYAWLGVYASYTDPPRRLLARIVRRGINTLTASDLVLPRSDLLQVAERLAQGSKPRDAAALLQRLPGGPQDAGELALLAAAEGKAGDLAQARTHADAALRRDPTNKRATEVVDRIDMAARLVSPALLERYAGRYATPFGPLEVARSGTGLVARFEDQPPSEMLAMADDRFLIESIGLPIEFVQGPDGRVNHAVVQAGSPVTLRRL